MGVLAISFPLSSVFVREPFTTSSLTLFTHENGSYKCKLCKLPMKNQNEFLLHTKSKKHLQLVQKLKQAQLARNASVGQKNPEPPSSSANLSTSSPGTTKSSVTQIPAGFFDRPALDEEAPQQITYPEVHDIAPEDSQPPQLSQRELFRMLEEEEEQQFSAQISSKITESPE